MKETIILLSATEKTNRWTYAINKRLMIDRMLTNRTRFKKKALNEKLVKGTWKGCLNNEEDLPANWPTTKGVLVGISQARPPGRSG